MKPCEVCGLRECNHRVPADLKEEIGDEVDDDYDNDVDRRKIEYYARSKKTVFVPVEVEYHEPTDVIFRFHGGYKNTSTPKGNGQWSYEASFCLNDVERAMKDSPVRKIILDEINLYEEEKKELQLDNERSDLYPIGVHNNRLDSIDTSIKALKLLANKF